MGGKRNLARRLCAMIDSTPHRIYVEPFVGMGGVFLRRTRKPTSEVINDLSGDIATFYRVLQEHYPYFVDMLRWRVTSRAEFQRLLAIPGDRLTDLQRAARFLYLQRCAFGGRVEGRSFGVSKATPGRFDVTKLEPVLADLNERLSGVVIEQLPYADLIRRYDDPQALFYLDPPYDQTEGYGLEFGRADYVALAAQLAGIAGRFIMSINATDFIRETFAAFSIEEVETTWTLSTAAIGGGKRVTELIIRGGRADRE
jgi:DNA adenine methylase